MNLPNGANGTLSLPPKYKAKKKFNMIDTIQYNTLFNMIDRLYNRF